MNVDKQKLLLSCLVSNRDLLALCAGILKPSYFDASLKKSVKFIQDYFEKFKDTPKESVVRTECGLILEPVGELARSDISYVAQEVETFCRERAITEAILTGPELLQQGDFGKILETLKSAISVGLQKDMGTDYFADPATRLISALEGNPKISTGIPELDDAIGGGVSRQELILFAANSGGGKSMTMLNIAKNMLAHGLNGVYISLEMAETTVSKRLDSMISRVGQDALMKEINTVAAIIERERDRMGKFIIKRLPENRTNVNTIRSYLQQLEQSSGFKPDFIVIDYIDILGSSMQISQDNLFVRDKYVVEEARALGFDFNAVIVTASQLGRSAIEAEKLNQAHIQGGISKINTCDYAVGIKQDDLMRASGEIYLEILKSRNSAGTGKRLLLGWDPVSLTIVPNPKTGNGLALNKKSGPTVGTQGSVFKKKKDDGILGLLNT
jgi:KaiC/GvpD/RAD55 family RecA-like ATPase